MKFLLQLGDAPNRVQWKLYSLSNDGFRSIFRPERADLRPKRDDLRPERAVSRPEGTDLRPGGGEQKN